MHLAADRYYPTFINVGVGSVCGKAGPRLKLTENEEAVTCTDCNKWLQDKEIRECEHAVQHCLQELEIITGQLVQNRKRLRELKGE